MISVAKIPRHVWAWKEKHGGIIIQQLKSWVVPVIGPATLHDGPGIFPLRPKVFVDLYKKGLIYRGKRMVNWDLRLARLFQMRKSK